MFAVEIVRLGGAIVTAPSTRDVGLDADGHGRIVRAGGSNGHIALLPGPYTLNTEISDHGRQHVYDHVQTALRFDVIAGDSNEVNGLVTMRPTLRFQRPD